MSIEEQVFDHFMTRHLRDTDDELPLLPGIESVLRQLRNADNDGLAHRKHNLLLPHTPFQRSKTCANSNFSDRMRNRSPRNPTRIKTSSTSVLESLHNTITESPDTKKLFKSLSYLDHIALVCLAAGFRDCRAPDCLQYRSELERVVPKCCSWPRLRDWALCITSCVSRTVRDIDREPNLLKDGVPLKSWRYNVEDLIPRFRNHIYAFISLTDRETSSWFRPGRASEVDNIFDPSADLSVDVTEVFHLVSWFRNIFRTIFREGLPISSPFWYHDEFLPVAGNAIEEASSKIVELGFCQKRVWEVIKNAYDGEIEVVPLVRALEHLPQLGHKDHESCTPAFCDDASKNYTSVTQLHMCHSQDCATTTNNMFNQGLLVAALKDNTMTTAWKLDGMSLVAQDSSYLAISHVWSDGTGVGAWKAGQVNKCLWDFWVAIARHLKCDGVWWDTVCIPQDKKARSIALNNMHHNYTAAKYTVVHDLYLAGIQWENNESACIALALSPWFTRGWTALELLLSTRVFVLFRQGIGYALKDLDNEILAKHPVLDSHAHWIATLSVERLRRVTDDYALMKIPDILLVLQGRYTSWSRDQSVIAGLMCGLTDHATDSEQQITKQILRKIGFIDKRCLLHGLPTMSEPQLSWCPPRFIDLPSAIATIRGETRLFIYPDGTLGTLDGPWEFFRIPKAHVDTGVIQPFSMNMYVRGQVQRALQKPEEHIILTCRYSFDAQGLLVKLKTGKFHSEDSPFYCKYIGAVNIVPIKTRNSRFRCKQRFCIGYKQGMADFSIPEDWGRSLSYD